jgi:hypothetical protein
VISAKAKILYKYFLNLRPFREFRLLRRQGLISLWPVSFGLRGHESMYSMKLVLFKKALDAFKLLFLKETISLFLYLEQHQAAEKLLQSEDEKIFTATKKILLELYSDTGKRGLSFCLCRRKRLN